MAKPLEPDEHFARVIGGYEGARKRWGLDRAQLLLNFATCYRRDKGTVQKIPPDKQRRQAKSAVKATEPGEKYWADHYWGLVTKLEGETTRFQVLELDESDDGHNDQNDQAAVSTSAASSASPPAVEASSGSSRKPMPR